MARAVQQQIRLKRVTGIQPIFAAALVLAASLSPADGADLSPEMKAYAVSLFPDRDRLMSEFQLFSAKFPIQSAYLVGLFSTKSCGNSPPSPRLTTVAAIDVFIKTIEGQKVFVVMGLVSSMTYPTPEQKARFCSSAKNLVSVAEVEASKKP